MNCYYHPDKPAIGLCKHCQRGLCSDCAALVDDSLACKDRHEEQARALEEMTKQNILKSKRTRSDYLRNTIFYGIFGIPTMEMDRKMLKGIKERAERREKEVN